MVSGRGSPARTAWPELPSDVLQPWLLPCSSGPSDSNGLFWSHRQTSSVAAFKFRGRLFNCLRSPCRGTGLHCGGRRDTAPRAGCTRPGVGYIKAPRSARPGMSAEFGSWTGSPRPLETRRLVHRKGLCFGKAPALLRSGSGSPCGTLLLSMFSQALILPHFCGRFI